VDYAVADLFDPPRRWRRGFGLVVEIATVQALPRDLRAQATKQVSDLLAPGGTLLVGAFAAEDDTEVDGPPWPLTRADIESFATDGVLLTSIQRTRGGGRWFARFTR
jgi:hypothetical protein